MNEYNKSIIIGLILSIVFVVVLFIFLATGNLTIQCVKGSHLVSTDPQGNNIYKYNSCNGDPAVYYVVGKNNITTMSPYSSGKSTHYKIIESEK